MGWKHDGTSNEQFYHYNRMKSSGRLSRSNRRVSPNNNALQVWALASGELLHHWAQHSDSVVKLLPVSVLDVTLDVY